MLFIKFYASEIIYEDKKKLSLRIYFTVLINKYFRVIDRKYFSPVTRHSPKK